MSITPRRLMFALAPYCRATARALSGSTPTKFDAEYAARYQSS
jgi:hypothetical protein